MAELTNRDVHSKLTFISPRQHLWWVGAGVDSGMLLILIGAEKLRDMMRGVRNGISEFGKELDQQAHDAGRSAGGIFGKPAAEALTPENQTAELYDPAVFRRGSRRRSFRQLLRHLWRSILAWLRIKH